MNFSEEILNTAIGYVNGIRGELVEDDSRKNS